LGAFSYENDGENGVSVFPTKNRLCSKCQSEAEVDIEIGKLKAELDRIGELMRAVLRKRNTKN